MANRWLYFIVGGLVVVAILVALGGGFSGDATHMAGTPAPGGDVNVKVETPAGGSTAPAGGGASAAGSAASGGTTAPAR